MTYAVTLNIAEVSEATTKHGLQALAARYLHYISRGLNRPCWVVGGSRRLRHGVAALKKGRKLKKAANNLLGGLVSGQQRREEKPRFP